MVNTSSSGMHHLHTRKRIYKNLEEYPHPDKWKNIMDKVVYFASFLGIVMTIPQILVVWVQHLTEGISIISWIGYTIIAIVWTIYGFLHKEKPLIIINGMWIILDLLIVLGVLLFR